MTTSPRVALCVVLGSWGALLVAAGVAGERQTHSSSHRLCQVPLAAGIKIHGATALAGIQLDYLYTDDACGHSAPLAACGMTVCHPFDRPAELANSSPAPVEDYAESYDEQYAESYGERYAKSFAEEYAESNDDEANYYEELDGIYSATPKGSDPRAVADSIDDVYYDDLRGAYIPNSAAHTLNVADDRLKAAEHRNWDEGAQGWYADPQDTDDLDANIWNSDAPNVDAPRANIDADLPYYGEDDPCDDRSASRAATEVVHGSLADLAASPWHSIGQDLAIQQNFENDGLPKDQTPTVSNATLAASQVIAHLMSIETTPQLPSWMSGDFAFDEDWRGCDVLPYPACELEPYPTFDRTPSPAEVSDSAWTENRSPAASSSLWIEDCDDFCNPEFDDRSEVDHALSLAIRREIVRLALIQTHHAFTWVCSGYRAVWNDVALSWERFAHEVAVIAHSNSLSRTKASAKRPVRVEPYLHLGL